MDVKTTIPRDPIFEKGKLGKALLHMVFFTVALFAGVGQLSAQEIKTDTPIPALSACGDPQMVTVKVAGLGTCTDPVLDIKIPPHFELVTGTVQIGGGSPTLLDENALGAKVQLEATATEQVVTFQVRALCEAIPTEGTSSPSIDYTVTGCTSPLEGDSEALNVVYAVLHPTVVPTVSSGIIGDAFERTITITNKGNGATRRFTVQRAPSTGLAYVSNDVTGLPAGLSLDPCS